MEDKENEINNKSKLSPAEQKQGKTGIVSFIWEILKFTVLALLIVIPIRIYIAQPYIVSGDSMIPTFSNGEYLIVDQLSYRFEKPERGDVIVFRFPQNPKKFFIKRIVGLPSESLEMQDGALIIINDAYPIGTILKEPYLARQYNDTLTQTLQDDEYFVMGDNRSASLDSRIWGPLSEDLIIGRAFVRLLPVTKIGVLPGKAHY